MVKPHKPLAAYVRVSRVGSRDEDRLRSPDLQRDAIQRYGDAEGFKIDWREPELDVSGSKAKRPILDGILADVADGKLGGLVVAKLDRLSRMSPRDRVLLFEQIEDAGGVVLSASEQLDTSTPEGRFSRDVFLGVARMQWEKYREGFEAAKAGSIASGVAVNSRAPVGYRKNATTRRLEPDPATAPVIREVFERRAAGASTGELLALLRSAGVTTSQNGTWSRQALAGLLRSRTYLGEIAYGLDRRFTNPAAHEPIVGVDVWHAAQAGAGRRPRSTASRRGKLEYMLVGLVRCTSCRYTCAATTSSRGVRLYRCNGRHSGGTCLARASIKADVLEAAVLRLMWHDAEDVTAEAGAPPAAPDLQPLRDVLAAAERDLEQAKSIDVQRALGDDWLPMLQERAAAVDAANTALGQAVAQQPEVVVPPVRELHEQWDELPVEQRRDMLAAILHTDALELRRDPRAVVIWPRDITDDLSGPTRNAELQAFYAELPRRGFRATPELRPFPPPPPEAVVLEL